MEVGYWLEVDEEEACKKLEFFTTDGKRWWKVVPMGDLNAAPAFVAIMMKLNNEWDTLAKERGLKMLHQKMFLVICYCVGAQPSNS